MVRFKFKQRLSPSNAPYILHYLILIAPVVRYDGWLDSSLSKDCRLLTHPTFYCYAKGRGTLNPSFR